MGFITYIQNYITITGFGLLTKYSAIKNKITKCANYMYMYHPWITDNIDISIYGYKWICAMHNNYNIEPYHKYWISSNILMQSNFNMNTTSLHIFDKHTYIYDNNLLSCSYTFIRNLNTCNLLLKQPMTSLCKENLLYARFNNIYISRIQHHRHTIDEFKYIDDFNTPSSVGFLSITLAVGDYKINIDIEENHMYVNNELFSTGFIQRYLKYNNIEVSCNTNYIINIMDNDINMFTLKPNQYIILNKTDYTITTIANTDK